MKINELITEAYRSEDIAVILIKKGYKLIGDGTDQDAYLEPGTGKVLKIFGSDDNYGEKHSDGHRMFKIWVEYCEKNKSNPFLPKFDGWEGFELNGKKYLQIRMERLQELPLYIANVLEEFVYHLGAADTGAAIASILQKIGSSDPDDDESFDEFDGLEEQGLDALNELMIQLGKQRFVLLLKTIVAVKKLGTRYGFGIDMHGNNFMHRNDGIPVIVDPWLSDDY